MDIKNVFIIARKEVVDSFSNRWFLLYTASFAVLALLLLSLASPRGSAEVLGGGGGFGRTAASLVNLVIMFVPLVSLIMGAITLSSERERGTLLYLLSHPVTRAEVFLGKYAGLVVPIGVSITLGFGVSGVVIALEGGAGQVGNYLLTVLLSLYLAASLCGIGILVSALSSRSAKAIGIALFLWLLVIVLGDLGIIGTTLAMDLGMGELFLLVLVNPTQIFKIAAVLNITERFEVLGPVGIYALRTWGREGTFALLFAALTLWVIAPLVAAFLSFCVWRKEA